MNTTTDMQLVSVDRLVPYVNNARTHSQEQITKLRSSLREIGFINPVIIDRNFNVIAGHGRIAATKEEGITEVPRVFADFLTEAQNNASYFAFTATPKNKTLETFGILVVDEYGTPVLNDKGELQHKPFHVYTMKQARAMVVTASIPQCIEYYYAINKCLSERHSPYKTIIAFSGECKYNGQEPPLTSAGMNGFPDAKIPKTFKADPYRILIVADMFQTGFDEPLLHTMYVDKMLYGIKAVQTLSRLNRCHPKKYDTFVLDFANKPEIIEESFSRYYRTTILSGETDPNKLYDLVATMEGYQVYSGDDVERLVNLYLDGADRDKLDPVLDPLFITLSHNRNCKW